MTNYERAPGFPSRAIATLIKILAFGNVG